MDLKIQPVDIDENQYNRAKHSLWEFPSAHLILGKIKSGKSTLLHNMISKLWTPVFDDRVILFSPSCGDPIIRDLIDNDKLFYHSETFSMDALETILSIIKSEEDDPTKAGRRWLVVIDDAMGSINHSINSYEGRRFCKMYASFRHMYGEGKITIVMAIQKFIGAVSPVVRANLHYVYLLGKASEKEIKDMSEELNAIAGGDSKKFTETYHRIKSGSPYNFAFLDFNRMVMMRNFDTVMYSADHGEFSDDEGEDGEEVVIPEEEGGK
jgi:hypothetical protein